MRSRRPGPALRSPGLLLVTVVLVGLGGVTGDPGAPPAAASCAAPSLAVEPGRVPDNAPGDVLGDVPNNVLGRTPTVTGTSFVDGCQDAVGCSSGPGCDTCSASDPPRTPHTDVALRLRQAGRTWRLGVADADATGAVRWRVRLPGGVRPGPARLVATGAGGLDVRVAP